MDRFLSIEVFVSAVELGSFSAAANAHNITAAMASKHVASIEKRLGATLLARTTRRQNLTEVGKNYYQHCKEVLRLLDNAEAGAEALTKTPKGILRVTSSLGFGSLELAPKIAEYLIQYPDVNVELSLTDRYVDLIEEGFDVAIRIGELEDSSLKARKVAKFELAICASPDYLAKFGTPKSPEDLEKHECLGFTNWNNQGGWQLVQKQFKRKGNLSPRFEANNGYALRAIALRGIGIVMQPRALLKPEIEAGRLIEIMKEYLPKSRPVYAVFPSERQLAPKLSSFVDFLAENFD